MPYRTRTSAIYRLSYHNLADPFYRRGHRGSTCRPSAASKHHSIPTVFHQPNQNHTSKSSTTEPTNHVLHPNSSPLQRSPLPLQLRPTTPHRSLQGLLQLPPTIAPLRPPRRRRRNAAPYHEQSPLQIRAPSSALTVQPCAEDRGHYGHKREGEGYFLRGRVSDVEYGGEVSPISAIAR